MCVSVSASALALELLGFDKLVALKTDSPFPLNTSFWENYSMLFLLFYVFRYVALRVLNRETQVRPVVIQPSTPVKHTL